MERPALRGTRLDLPADLDAALRRRAAEEDRTITSVVRAALRAHLGVPATQ